MWNSDINMSIMRKKRHMRSICWLLHLRASARGISMRKLEKQSNMNKRIDVVLRKFRSRINSYPPGMCPLVLYRSLLQVSMNQSCGKCVPCRDGLIEVDRLLGKILRGAG